MQCAITVERKDENLHIVNFEISQLVTLSLVEQNKLKIGCSLLREMGKTYNMNILPEVIMNDRVTIPVRWLAN